MLISATVELSPKHKKLGSFEHACEKNSFVFTLRDIIHEFFLWLTCNHFGSICRHYRKENTKAFEVCPENGFKKSFLAILVVVNCRKLVAIPRATALFQLRFI